jgi:hypothetical protein
MFTNNVIICNNSVIVFLIEILYNNSMKRTATTNTAKHGNIKNLGSNRSPFFTGSLFLCFKTELKGNEKNGKHKGKHKGN